MTFDNLRYDDDDDDDDDDEMVILMGYYLFHGKYCMGFIGILI